MSHKEFCPVCGQSIMEHKHTMSKAMANIFKMLPLHNPFHLQKDLNLTKNQYANFQKLRYWGLVERIIYNDKSGYWQVTDHGRRFASNELAIPKTMITFNNHVRRAESPMIKISDCDGSWKNRNDYQREMTPVPEFSNSLF